VPFLSGKYDWFSIADKTYLDHYPDMLVGYARVSTLDQNLDLQRDALTKAGCERIFEEKKSGKAGTKRPEFDAALAYLRREDVLVVWKLDRLGRSLVEMMRTIDALRLKEVHFRSLTEQFDSGTAHGRFALQMHGAMAEYFLDLNRERTMEGLKAARARGRKGGRPKKLTEADLEVGRALLQSGTISIAVIAKRLGVSRDTFYNYFPQARARSHNSVRS
jgi:DNA invertase Pin-like site-specific DNA recombinase